MILEFSILIMLLFLSAFFSGAETSLTSLKKHQVHSMKKNKRKGHKSLLQLIKNPSAMLATILLGNNIVNIALTALATLVVVDILRGFNIISPGYVTLITTFVVTVFLLVFGEVTPKTIALAKAQKFSLIAAPIINVMALALSPFVYILNKISSVFVKLVGGHNLERHSLVTEDEVVALIDAAEDSGAIEKEEEEMMYDVIRFGDKVVEDVMTEMEDVVAVEENFTLEELIDVVKEEPRSRLPVYRQFRTNIIGMVYLKDLLLNIELDEEDDEKFILKKHPEIIRKPYFVRTDNKVTKVLKDMRNKRIHIAIVNDKDKKTSGIITIEDLIEEIIGEIEDEYED